MPLKLMNPRYRVKKLAAKISHKTIIGKSAPKNGTVKNIKSDR